VLADVVVPNQLLDNNVIGKSKLDPEWFLLIIGIVIFILVVISLMKLKKIREDK
jgi:uncharacterized integral membrane protein